MEHRVKQQIQLTTAGPHEKVGAADGAGEGLADFCAQVLDAKQQGYAQGQGQANEGQYTAPVPKAGGGQEDGELELVHGATSRAMR